MSALDDLIAKARGGAKPERKRFKLPVPDERCACGSDCFIRECDQPDWSCLRCFLETGSKAPTMAVGRRDGWQGGIVGYE